MTQTKHRLSAEARRAAVLDTARRVFSGSSYRGVTTAEIAREAGISEPILYRHFGSKRDLYLACLDQAWQEFHDEATVALAEDPAGCLGVISDRYMAKGAKFRLVDLWIQALTEASDDPVIAKALRRQIRGLHDFLAGVIRDGQHRGVVNEDRDPTQRRGSSSAGVCSRPWMRGSAACSATTCSGCATSAGAGCSPKPPEKR